MAGTGLTPESERALIERARTGDRDAGQRLFEAYQVAIYNYLQQMTRDPESAADLTQDVFVKALGSLPRLRRPEAFGRWLFQIAHNLVKDRAARPVAELPGTVAERPDPAAGPDRALLRGELAGAVERALAGLSPEHREVVLLHHLRGLEVEDVAAALRLPAGTIKSRLARARAILRRRLTPYVEDGP